MAQQIYDALNPSDVIMLEFEVIDLLNAFEIEGLAYEYWRTCATMRSVGKGASISWNEQTGWIEYLDRNPHPLLFEIYDRRIAREAHGFHTRAGTWMNDRATTSLADQFFAAQYRPSPDLSVFPTWDRARKRIAKTRARPNFNLFSGSLAHFAASNAFLDGAFKQRHGVSLSEVLHCLGVLSVLSSMTGEALIMRNRQERTERILTHQTNLLFRAYWCLALDLDGLAELICDAAPILGFKQCIPQHRVRTTLDFFSLDSISAKNIGLWSGGKRPLLIPLPDRGYMLDFVAIMPLLVGLFFGVPVPGDIKGSGFEQATREAISDAHFDVIFHGQLRWEDGSEREADAIVRLGDKLILIECVAIEEPVDLELSKPAVFAKRVARLSDKTQQASSLAQRLREAPVGKNFDFGWARRIDWRVVCPHHEFAWDLGGNLFDEIGEPRIVTNDELMDLLRGDEIVSAALRMLVHRARREGPQS